MYLITAYITFDYLWFIHGWLGRAIGLISMMMSIKIADDYVDDVFGK